MKAMLKKQFLKSHIAHGMLVMSYITRILLNAFPGEGSIYLGQEIKFTAPVFLGDEITIKSQKHS